MNELDSMNPGMTPDNGTGAPPFQVGQMPSSLPILSGNPTPNVTYHPADNDPEIQAAAVHHGRVADALNAVSKILSGGTGYRLKKNPDGSVDITEADMTPGQRWGKIAATALAGAAKGFAAGQGPGGMGRAAGAGFDEGLQATQNQQDRTVALAHEMNDQNRAQQMFKANMAKMNQDAIKSTWEMQQGQMKSIESEEDRQAQIQQHMTEMNATKFHVGGDDPNQLMDDVANQYNHNELLAQAHHDGRTVVYTTHDPKTGKVTGADIYMVPEDEMDKPYMQDYQRTQYEWDNSDPKNKPKEVKLGSPILAGSMKTKDVMLMKQNDLNQRNGVMQAWNKQEGDLAQQKAAVEAARAQAALAKEQIKQGKYVQVQGNDGRMYSVDLVAGEAKPINITGGAAPGTTLLTPAQYSKQMGATQKEIEDAKPLVNALTYAQNYIGGIASGQHPASGPSDEALLEQFFEVTKPSKGFRMSQPQQDMLNNARSWKAAAMAKAGHATGGTYYTDDQRRQIASTMYEVARAKGVHMGTGGTPVFVPSGGTLPSAAGGTASQPTPQQLTGPAPGPAAPGQAGGDVWSRSKIVQSAQ